MCRKNGFTLLSLCFLFGLSLPCSLSSEEASNPNDSANSSESIEQTATNLRESATSLRERLESRKIQVEAQVIYWQNIAASLTIEKENDAKASKELSDKLAQAESELSKLRTELTEISRLQLESKGKQNELKLGFENYKTESEKKIARLEKRARFWSFIGKFVLLVAAGEGAYIAASHFLP